jgi:iron complex outermembrane receptor protein
VRFIQGRFGYSYLHRSNVDGTVVPLLNTPKHKVFGSMVYRPVPKLRLIGSVNHEASRTAQDDGGVLLELDSYTTVNAKAAYSVLSGLDAELTSSNVFDRNYQLYPGFPEYGRVVAVNLRYRF